MSRALVKSHNQIAETAIELKEPKKVFWWVEVGPIDRWGRKVSAWGFSLREVGLEVFSDNYWALVHIEHKKRLQVVEDA